MERKEILEKLAAKEITRTQAEEMLAALGEPVPERIPDPPPQGRVNGGKGCLIAAVVLALLILLGMVLMVAGWFYFRLEAAPSRLPNVPTAIPMPEQLLNAPQLEIRGGTSGMIDTKTGKRTVLKRGLTRSRTGESGDHQPSASQPAQPGEKP